MTKLQLNNKVKNLKKLVLKTDLTIKNADEWQDFNLEVVTPTMKSIYGADATLESLSAKNLRTMIRLNIRFRAIPFYSFGQMIKD